MTTYRPDIDGLRAICIVSVVMFHAEFRDWSGGFVGVDIFFVISGYLITSLIGRQIAAGQFSLAGFYERRIRRLLAASIPVLLFTTLLALTFFTSDDIVTYCKSLLSFIAYGSNWFFLSQTGYFATLPSANPLLHTWSLAVEEQFYLVFPVLLLLLLRFPRAVIWVLAALAAFSFAYAQFEISRGNFDRAFFSSPARFWELLAGALLALAPGLIDRAARFALPMRVVGLAMIAASIILYSPATPFPGVAALLPACGALLLIAASPDSKDPVWRLLTASPVVYLGKISYSLYLWHWPVLGASRVLLLPNSDSDLFGTLAIGLSVVLASLSYHFVEQPVRTRRRLGRGRDMAVLLASTSLVGFAVGSFGWATGGWPTAASAQVEATVQRAVKVSSDLPEECFELQRDMPTDRKLCRFGSGTQGKADILVWGDSHAAVMFTVVRKYAEARGLTVAFAGRASCPALLGIRRKRGEVDYNPGCPDLNDAALTFIRDNDVQLVILATRWSTYAKSKRFVDLQGASAAPGDVFENAMRRTLDALKDRAVVIMEPVPESKASVPHAYLVLSRLGGSLDSISIDRTTHVRQQRAAVSVIERATASRDNTLRIDPAEVLCGLRGCVAEADGRLLYSDFHHLNVDGSLFLYPLIERELDRFLASRRQALAGSAPASDAR